MDCSTTAGPLAPGTPVRLLVGLLAWPALRLTDGAAALPGSPRPRFLGAGAALTFVRHRPEKPGGCVAADALGCRWYVPTDFLEACA